MGDMAQPTQFGVIGDRTGPDKTREAYRQRHEPRDAGHSAGW